MGLGLLLFLVTMGAAPFVADFYQHDPRVASTLRICALNFLLLPLTTVSLALLRRALEFKRLRDVMISAAVTGAVVSIGLALLGGGSLAAGGLGVVGGTAVVAAAGAALGSALGANITNAYISEDDSFRIEKFRGGTGIPVIVARGFMTEEDPNWRYAIQMIERRYPDSPIHRLHWGSKELKTLGAFALKNAGKKEAVGFIGRAAARATRQGAKLIVNEKGIWANGNYTTTVLVVNTTYASKYPTALRGLLRGVQGTTAADSWLRGVQDAADAAQGSGGGFGSESVGKRGFGFSSGQD
jgi:hypothetical protein